MRLLPQTSDDRLVELVGEGDDTAFEELCDRHVLDAFVFAHQMLESLEEAEQAVHHAFAAAHAYLAAGGAKIAFEPWLYTILSNHCLSVLRTRRSTREGSGDAAVVDIGEWRRKRRLFGLALPAAMGGKVLEKGLAACGLGGAGTAAVGGGSLLGGTLAKVAVVAALVAGGAGVAGTVEPDRAGNSAAAETARIHAGSSEAGTSWDAVGQMVATRAGDLVEQSGARVGTGERKRLERTAASPRVEGAPVDRRAAPGITGPVGGAPAPPPSAPPPPTHAAEAVPVPSSATVTEVVRTQVPAAGDLPAIGVPPVDDLTQVLEDVVVVPTTPPLDVQELLTPGADPPPS